jgi:glutamate-ammonia-ligase adenylyltransferase
MPVENKQRSPGWTRHWTQGTDSLIPADQRLAHVRACSPWVQTIMLRHPEWHTTLEASGRLNDDTGPSHQYLEQRINDTPLNTALRDFRNIEMLRIIWRDLCGLAPLGETLRDLTLLAEICLDTAVLAHGKRLAEKYGLPRDDGNQPQALVVIAMGKLGGVELNLSSDIDIIFAFPETGQCDGKRKLSNEEFFTRQARAVIASLSDVTEDGFCFRVDTRLRPFGNAGPIVASFAAMDQYYQREGRDWERYAFIKARPVAGDLVQGQNLVNSLKPFVYRRYIDFGAIEALQEMHASVHADASLKERLDDLKRGPGGIREIEFLAQTFQLLRGGQEPGLQTQSLSAALGEIENLGLIPTDAIDEIRQDYIFLRKLENRVQALRDLQTHLLPTGEDLERVSRSMRCESPLVLIEELASVRTRVSTRFNAIFPSLPEAHDDPQWIAMWRALRDAQQGQDTSITQPASAPWLDFIQRLKRQSLSDRASRRLDRFMPLLLDRIDRAAMTDETLCLVFDLVLAITRRSPYLVLLVQHSPALDRMLELFTRSHWIARLVIRYPALLDELIDPSLGYQIPTQSELGQSINRLLCASTDTEARLDGLNHLKLATTLRIAVAQLLDVLDCGAVLQALTSLADSMIAGVVRLASEEIRRRHGDLPGKGKNGGESLGVVGYGTLGAGELGYGSDLDLVFLFRQVEGLSDGKRALDDDRWFARLAQRVLSFLTAITPSGRLYEVDTRLRPNGRAGALVSSMTAFRDYQLKEAWTWELQAITRARFIAGDPSLSADFETVRTNTLAQPRAADDTQESLAGMREKIRHEKGRDPSLLLTPKHRPGGLVDIEFVAQLGILTQAHRDIALLQHTGTTGQILALRENGWLDRGQAETLTSTLKKLREARLTDLISARDAPNAIKTTDAAEIYQHFFKSGPSKG